MKLTACLLLLSGATIVVAALALLPTATPRLAFIMAGIAVEGLGLAILARVHRRAERARARAGASHIRSHLA